MKRLILALVMAGVFLTGTRLVAGADAVSADRAVIPFNGVLDLKGEKIALTFGDGPGGASVDLSRLSGGRYDLSADIRHLQVLGWDVATALNGHFECVGPSWSQRELVGEISTQYILLNYKPVRDAKIKFSVRERRLLVDEFWLGALSGKGSVELMAPHEMDADLELMSADIDGIWEILRARGISLPSLSGVIKGSVGFKGPLARPQLSGRFLAYNGRFKDFGYESIDLHFQGVYPRIRLEDTKVVADDGPSFRVSGALELDDIARLPVQLRQLKKDFVISDGASGRAWAFRRLNGVGAGGPTTQLKSFISGNADGRGEGDGAVGLQKHMGF